MSGAARIRRDHDARMAALKLQFDRGQKSACLYALDMCLSSRPQKPVHEWAVLGLAKALYDIAMVKAVSWDDVFGKPHKKRKKAQLQKERALSYKVAKRVLELRQRRPKPANIRGKVAGEFKISRAACKRYFESDRKWLQLQQRMTMEERMTMEGQIAGLIAWVKATGGKLVYKKFAQKKMVQQTGKI